MATYVTSVNGLSNFPNLTSLNLVVNQLTEVDLTGLPNLVQLYLSSNNIASVDLSNCPLLTQVNLQNNPSLNITAVPALGSCLYFSGYNCSISTTIVDIILLNLSNNGISGGAAFLDGGSNGIPTGTGISAALYLTGDAGWSVTYNT